MAAWSSGHSFDMRGSSSSNPQACPSSWKMGECSKQSGTNGVATIRRESGQQ